METSPGNVCHSGHRSAIPRKWQISVGPSGHLIKATTSLGTSWSWLALREPTCPGENALHEAVGWGLHSKHNPPSGPVRLPGHPHCAKLLASPRCVPICLPACLRPTPVLSCLPDLHRPCCLLSLDCSPHAYNERAQPDLSEPPRSAALPQRGTVPRPPPVQPEAGIPLFLGHLQLPEQCFACGCLAKGFSD